MAQVVMFEVHGRPIPQGSKRAFLNRATGRPIITDVQDQALGLWREAIAREARQVVYTPHRGPVAIQMVFYFARPKGHYGAKGLLPSASREKITKPDLDKLARSVMDALTRTLYEDDAQVIRLTVSKQWGNDTMHEGVVVDARLD